MILKGFRKTTIILLLALVSTVLMSGASALTFASSLTAASKVVLLIKGNPQFSRDQLSGEARLWYDRLWAAIVNPNQYVNSTDDAKSGDIYTYGRSLSTHITSLLQVLRVTGDPRLLEEVDRLAQLMRGQLSDTNGDGYLNWVYLHDPSAGDYQTDLRKMDEMMTHSLVATVAYAFHVNRDLDARYAERADFWTNFLKKNFEAKWRKRQNISSGFPFLEQGLTHCYTTWIRYHYYMHKLTGEQGYYNEAVRMASAVSSIITDTNTPLGVAAQWPHGDPRIGSSSTYGAQPMNYARYTVLSAADLALEGFGPFAEPGFMEKMACMLAYFIMDANAPNSFNGKIDGSDPGGESASRYAISPYTQLGHWDMTGRVKAISEQVYKNKESQLENPDRIYIPAGMVFSLLR